MSENKLIDETQLRVSFGNERSESGYIKTHMSASLSMTTREMIEKIISTGAGRYGSNFLEVSARLLISLLTGESIDYVVYQYSRFVIDKKEFKENVNKFAEYVNKVF